MKEKYEENKHLILSDQAQSLEFVLSTFRSMIGEKLDMIYGASKFINRDSDLTLIDLWTKETEIEITKMFNSVSFIISEIASTALRCLTVFCASFSPCLGVVFL